MLTHIRSLLTTGRVLWELIKEALMSPRAKGKAMKMSLSPAHVKEMLETEVQTLRKLSKELRKPNCRMRVPVEQFVERCFLLHRRLIERWGGWRYQGAEVMVEDPTFLRSVAVQEFASFVRSVQAAVRDKELAPEWSNVANGFIMAGNYNNIDVGALLSSKNFMPSYDMHGRAEQTLEKSSVPVLFRSRPTTPTERAHYGSMKVQQYINAEVRHGQRLSAAVMRALEIAEAPPVLVALYEKLFQRLGEQVWGAGAIPVRVTLSCAPSSFLRLGEYGENSCYQNGGGSEYSKFWLACDCADSFVALFHRMKQPKEGEKRKETEAAELTVGGRAWGVSCDKRGVIVSNFYMLPQNMVLPALKETLMAGMGIKNIDQVTPTRDQRWRTTITNCLYLNGDSLMLADKSAVKQKLMDHYLVNVFREGAAFGFYGNHGQGPAFIKVGTGNAYDIVSPPRQGKRYSALWPYKDVPLKELLAKSIAEEGSFSPLKGPVYNDDAPNEPF